MPTKITSECKNILIRMLYMIKNKDKKKKAALNMVLVAAAAFVYLFQLNNIKVFAENTDLLYKSVSEDRTNSSDSEHLRLYTIKNDSLLDIYTENGKINANMVKVSDYIPISQGDYINILCEEPVSSSNREEYYIYFYDDHKNIIWEVFNHLDKNTGERNRISSEELRELNGFQFYNNQAASFVRVAAVNNQDFSVIIWDGIHVGYPITGLSVVFDSKGNIDEMPVNASISIQIPDTALYLIAKPGFTFSDMFYGEENMKRDLEAVFPTQVLNLKNISGAKNVTILTDYNFETGSFSNNKLNGDLSDAIIAVDKLDYQYDTPYSLLLPEVARRIHACLDFTWEAKAPVGMFKEGIIYHGIPYRNSWTSASSVGWHISKQTFMNAANDPDSIFYHTPEGEREGAYYSLVCSSFASLVSGGAYPNTVFGMMRDPQNILEKTDYPIDGKLMLFDAGHCYIPISTMTEPTGKMVFTVAEQITPITSLRNIYDSISDLWKGIGTKTSYATKFKDVVSFRTFEEVPYDITTYSIKNGSARPNRGDQSVYTSNMDVVINIKDPNATRLYYQEYFVECEHGLIKSAAACGEAKYVEIETGTEKFKLRSATISGEFSGVSLKNGGIYGVWASVDDKQNRAPENVEYFEWYDLEEEMVHYALWNNILVSNSNFWYALVRACDDSSSSDLIYGTCVIPNMPAVNGIADYSQYAEKTKIKNENNILAFFQKGCFGAYGAGMSYVPWITAALK